MDVRSARSTAHEFGVLHDLKRADARRNARSNPSPWRSWMWTVSWHASSDVSRFAQHPEICFLRSSRHIFAIRMRTIGRSARSLPAYLRRMRCDPHLLRRDHFW